MIPWCWIPAISRAGASAGRGVLDVVATLFDVGGVLVGLELFVVGGVAVVFLGLALELFRLVRDLI